MATLMDRKTSFVVVLLHCYLSLATLLCMFAFARGNPNVLCRERERNALLTFKQGIIDHSNRLSSWVGEECCIWRGVGCDNITEHVVQLNLKHDLYDEFTTWKAFEQSQLGGVISNSLLELKHLHYLDLSGNNFEDAHIPSFFGGLRNLRYLNLSGAGFVGTIPHQLANLSNLHSLDIGQLYLQQQQLQVDNLEWLSHLSLLEFLDLSNVNLSKASDWLQVMNMLPSLSELRLSACDLGFNQIQVPLQVAFQNMSSLRNLYHLDLSNNGFKGKLPFLGNLCNLQHLDLSENELGGGVYELLGNSSLCRVNNIEFLDLGINRLSGPIPVSIEKLSTLRILRLDSNKLNETVPVSLGHLSNLEVLDISGNYLEGFVSDVHFFNLTNLKKLDASYNLNLALQVSSNWVPPFQLELLGMRSWTLGPQFPTWLKSQKDLKYLHLSNASISDVIPSWFWSLCSTLQWLDLRENQIRGSIPSLSCGKLIFLDSNKFYGPLPDISPHIIRLGLSDNLFHGSLSPLICAQKDKMRDVEVLDLSKNLLSGELPNCWMNYSQLQVLNLGSNKLTGNIPSSLGSLSALQWLSLNKNNLSGDLPLSLQNYKYLENVDLSDNHLSGDLSIWLGTSSARLQKLVLRSNWFHGSIPQEFCHFNSLQIMDLSENSLSGPIPQCFGNLSAMAREIFGEGTLVSWGEIFLITKGVEYEYGTWPLPLVIAMDLSSNNLGGEIPEQLTNLYGLQFLNLSNNQLHGKIPEKINFMKSLESLDISMNQLRGVIPQGMASLTFLSYLNLSYNNFYGRIPSGTQLQSFTALSFIGNHDLCGPPLTSSCIGDDIPLEPTPNVNDEDGEDGGWIDMKWFYMSMPFGFVVGFWGVFGPLAFNKAWRYAFFQFLDNMKYKLFIGV